jgi:type IV pilus assembly protein PilQ
MLGSVRCLGSSVGPALAATLAFGCMPETQERSAASPPTSLGSQVAASPSSPLALPESAFRSDSGADAAPSPGSRSRFDTRRIGMSDRDADGETAASRAFHGAPVDLDLKSADLANVFRLLADVGRVNIVVGGEITGTVTLRLKHVPWDQALDLVARTHGLELRREGTVILVRAAEPNAAVHARVESGIAAARAIGDP